MIARQNEHGGTSVDTAVSIKYKIYACERYCQTAVFFISLFDSSFNLNIAYFATGKSPLISRLIFVARIIIDIRVNTSAIGWAKITPFNSK